MATPPPNSPDSPPAAELDHLGHDFTRGRLTCSRCKIGHLELTLRQSRGEGLASCSGRPVPRAHSGNKYHRQIQGLKAGGGGVVTVDVYSVLTAFPTGHPGCDHAVKKILCAGIRGKGSRVQDLREARDALTRAVEDAEADEAAAATTPPHV